MRSSWPKLSFQAGESRHRIRLVLLFHDVADVSGLLEACCIVANGHERDLSFSKDGTLDLRCGRKNFTLGNSSGEAIRNNRLQN
jgi:hypothetical protein